jgi:hypothetical protein
VGRGGRRARAPERARSGVRIRFPGHRARRSSGNVRRRFPGHRARRRLARRELRDAHRLSAGAERLADLQQVEAERRGALASAAEGHLAALVGWTIQLPQSFAESPARGSAAGGLHWGDDEDPPKRDTALVVGVVKKRILVRFEDGHEDLLKPLLKSAPPASGFVRLGRKREEPVPITLLERAGYYGSRSPPPRASVV